MSNPLDFTTEHLGINIEYFCIHVLYKMFTASIFIVMYMFTLSSFYYIKSLFKY